MGSTISNCDCPVCGGINTVREEWWYRTGEYSQFCSKCGEFHSHHIVCNNKGEFVRTYKKYPIEECFLTILDEDEKTPIWKYPIAKLNEDQVMGWIINTFTPVDYKIPEGKHNLYYKDMPIFYNMCSLEILGNYLIVGEVKWEEVIIHGYGVITIEYDDGEIISLPFGEDLNREEALEKVQKFRLKNPSTKISATLMIKGRIKQLV